MHAVSALSAMPRSPRRRLILAAPAARAADVVVFAAASLKNALDAVSADWAKASGDTATISYAASSALAKQIEEGAPADIFFSADLDWMDYLEERKLIDPATRDSLLGNRDRAGRQRHRRGAGGDRAGVRPRGRARAAASWPWPTSTRCRPASTARRRWRASGSGTSVEASVAQADNVRAALALVALGEAPLGIVYATDANAEDKVTVVGSFPDDSHPPIVYPVARTASSTSDAATSFLDYLATPEARAAFEAQGFTVLD